MIQGRSHPLDESSKGRKALPIKLVNILIPNYFSKYKRAILEQDATAFALYSILKLHSISAWDLQILLLLWAHLAEKHYLPQLNRWPKAFLRCILVNITPTCLVGVERGRVLGGRDKRRGIEDFPFRPFLPLPFPLPVLHRPRRLTYHQLHKLKRPLDSETSTRFSQY